jgi:hypothetical protein
MKRQKILFFTGLFLILMPLLGFPVWFKNFTTILAGVFICLFSYTMRGAVPFFKRKRKEEVVVPEQPVLDIRPDEEASSHVLRLDNEKNIH